MAKNTNLKIILIAVIFLAGFCSFAFEASAYSNVAQGKGFYSNHPNPYDWQGLTDNQIVWNAWDEGHYEDHSYATDAADSWPKWVIIDLGGTYNIDLVRLYKEFGADATTFDDDPLCDWGTSGCASCSVNHSNTRTVQVESRNGGGGWTNWDQYTFPSSPGGSRDWNQGSKIPATEVRITFWNSYYQWRTSSPCTCSNCGNYVFLREAQVFGDPPMPPADPTISVSCPSPGTAGNVSWTAPAGATYYAFRLNNETLSGWDGSCGPANGTGDICETTTSNSRTFTGSPGSNYTAWIHACNAYGCSPAGNGRSFSCTPPSPPPTASCSVSPNPVPYGGDPGITLTSTNAAYCYVLNNWSFVDYGYFTSGTYYPGAQTTVGANQAQVRCFNSSFTANSGWQTCSYTVSPPPTASCSVSPNPVLYGGNPGITLSSTNAYYCAVYNDGSNVQSGYFTSGTFYPGAQTTPGTHTGQVWCYNSAWAGSGGWAYCPYTVSPAPINGVCGSANNNTYPSSYSSPPVDKLCSAGTASAISGDGSASNHWTWRCNGLNGGSPSPLPLCSAKKFVRTTTAWKNDCTPACGGGTETGSYTDEEGDFTSTSRACAFSPCPPGYREVAPW